MKQQNLYLLINELSKENPICDYFCKNLEKESYLKKMKEWIGLYLQFKPGRSH